MCCISYKGVDYHYAFEFNVPTPYIPGASSINNNGTLETFKIVISKYRTEFDDYTALCLNNEFRTISHNKLRAGVFFDSCYKIVDYTLSDRKAYFESNGIVPFPLRTVENKDFINEFERCKSLNMPYVYYRQYPIQVKTFLEKSEPIITDASDKFEEYIDMKYFSFKLLHVMPNIQNFKGFII